ncbi:hypothetical protein LJR231_001570 [Phyllobacterium sp. LjRoot231]|uniref:hypothetical protein n=1 Tax=Phyllobacterium sp. LjRoot231 TaxID=3342289 RepID=UPI003ECFFF32
MAMIDIEEFLPDVLTNAPSCPEPLAYRWIREAAKEVCQRGKMWREWDEFQVTSPESEGTNTNQSASIFSIESATLDGSPLEAQTLAWLDTNIKGWNDLTDIASAKYVTQLTPNTVTVVPKMTGLLKLRLVLFPSRTAESLPDFLLEQYGATIAKGASGRVLTTPNKDFANPQLGLALLSEFKTELDTIALNAAKGQQRSRLRVTGRYF